MMEEKIKNNLLIFMLFVFALGAILFFAGNSKLNEQVRLDDEREKRIQIILNDMSLIAKAVSIYDIDQNREIYGKNQNEPLPIASLAKIMAVSVALNKYHPDDILTISQNAIDQIGDFGLLINEKWKVSDLAKLTLIVSANDGIYALAENDDNLLEKMNSKARKIGMEHVTFLNFTGLDIDLNNAGAYASAQDVNTMAMYALRAYPEIFQATTFSEINLTSESGFIHNFKNTNTLVEKIPNLLFSKTGFTEIAGGNLTIIFRDKRDYEMTVTILGSTIDGRFSDMEKIVDVLYNL